MGTRLAVLDWTDFQGLMAMSSQSFERSERHFEDLEVARRNLIEGFLIYLRDWLPGRQIDDESRRPLISALDAFSNALRKSMDSGQDSPSRELYVECIRIKNLLEAALTPDEPSGGGAVSVS